MGDDRDGGLNYEKMARLEATYTRSSLIKS